jgi:uncharacterized membrane protein
MKGLRLTKTSWLLLIVLVVAATLVIYFFVQHEVQSASLTCKRCHFELYKTWQASKEHPPSLASCRQCHGGSPMAASMPPGFSGKNEQVNAHCLVCHLDITEQVQVERKLIKISHRRHIDEGLGCVECHRTVAHAAPVFQSNRPHKEACYRCHIREIDGSEKDRSCNMCHYIILSTPPAQS